MSDTPKTDEIMTYANGCYFASDGLILMRQHARRLERELNEANRLLALARSHPYIPNSLAQLLNEPHKR